MTDNKCLLCGFPKAVGDAGHVCPNIPPSQPSSGPMSKQDLFVLHREMSQKALDLMLKKNADYSGGADDPFKNFQGSLIFDVEPEVGTMIRMNDKFQRVHAFLRNGSLAVQSEGVMDIGLDLINYAVLLTGQLLNRSRAKAKLDFNITAEYNPVHSSPMSKQEWDKLAMGTFDSDVEPIDLYGTVIDREEGVIYVDKIPIKVPDGYRIRSVDETVKKNDLTWDTMQLTWITVPKTKEFWGKVGNINHPIICWDAEGKTRGEAPLSRQELTNPIPPTVPIPEGYAMVTDGMTLMDNDLWRARNNVHGDRWVAIPDMDVGKTYDSFAYGSPVIRRYVQSESIKIHNTVGDPCSWCGAVQGQQHRDHCKRGDTK